MPPPFPSASPHTVSPIPYSLPPLTNKTNPDPKVVNWFADRSDLILLVFEAQKLDVPEEFRQVMEAVIAQHGDRVSQSY